MKILVTGNKKRGLAKVIHDYLGYFGMEVECISRETGANLIMFSGRSELLNKSKNYDVFINCSKLSDFYQTIVLKEVWDYWCQIKKTGHIINIGSTVDTGLKGGSRLYAVEKVALRNLSRKLTYDTLSGNGIKVTYVSFGYLDTEGVSFKDMVKIDLKHVVHVIKWLLEAPDYMNINEISIDPIQEM